MIEGFKTVAYEIKNILVTKEKSAEKLDSVRNDPTYHKHIARLTKKVDELEAASDSNTKIDCRH